jgi:RecB family exonuclease
MVRAAAYSPSRLQVYQACPRRYYYQYVIKVPTRRQAAQSVGISLHGALEEVQQAGGLEVTGIEGALQLLLERWESEGFADAAEEAEAKRRAEKLLAEYLARFGEGPGKPVMLEKKLVAHYEDVPLLGIVDRLDRLPDGQLELIDYKSGRAPERKPEVHQQLAIYRFLVKQQLGEYPAQVAIHHLAANTRITLDLVPEQWDELVARAAQSARAIERDQDFDPQVGAACQRCDYNSRCLAFKRAQREAAESL